VRYLVSSDPYLLKNICLIVSVGFTKYAIVTGELKTLKTYIIVLANKYG